MTDPLSAADRMGGGVIVSGTRHAVERSVVVARLAPLGLKWLAHGGARGVDEIARNWALAAGVVPICFQAPWKAIGKGAGTLRNAMMVELMQPRGVLCFPCKHSKGTWDMKRRAEAAGMQVVVVEVDCDD